MSATASASALSSAETDKVLAINRKRKGFARRIGDEIVLAQYCGAVNIGDRVLEVLPKVSNPNDQNARTVLLRLLRDARRFPLYFDFDAGQTLADVPLLDAFIKSFFHEVANIIRGGLLKKYHQVDEDSRFVRGRIVTQRQFTTNASRSDRISCRFDELAYDNIWNQILKSGIRSVGPWIQTLELKREWNELLSVFIDVSDVEIVSPIFSRLIFDRQAKRYRNAIRWVKWIFQIVTPEARAGENSAPGLLLDMNVLFERAVISALARRSNQKAGLRAVSQESTKYLARTREGRKTFFRLRPDLIVRKGSSVAIIADTKWKMLTIGDNGELIPPPADIIQMQTYAIAYNCERLALVYPWYEELGGSVETAFELTPVGSLQPVVDIICIDISNDNYPIRRGLRSDISALAGWVT